MGGYAFAGELRALVAVEYLGLALTAKKMRVAWALAKEAESTAHKKQAVPDG
jgi:hypothetical protein